MAVDEHDAIHSELARYFIIHKADLGMAERSDFEVAAQADEIALYLAARVGMAQATNDAAFLRTFGWLVRALERLDRGERLVGMDG